MNIAKSIQKLITLVLISFIMLSNLVNLATNSELNKYVYDAYSATSVSECYSYIADFSVKFITDFVIKITCGQLGDNKQKATPCDNKTQDESNSSPFAIVTESTYKSIKTFISFSSDVIVASKFFISDVLFCKISSCNRVGFILLAFICFLGLARSDTEDNSKKNINTIKVRLV